jgi:hypothetical protein
MALTWYRRLLLPVAILVATVQFQGCTGAFNSSLQLDGKTLPIKSTCVRSATDKCLGPADRQPNNEIVCNALGPLGQKQIEVWLNPLDVFVIEETGVRRNHGYKENELAARGGVTNFDPAKHADVNIDIAGHRFSGRVRC